MVLEIKLSIINFKDMVDKAQRLMPLEIKSAVKYANSKHITRYIKYIQNNRDQRIEVIADGVSNENTSKVDLFMMIGGRLSRTNISLKVGKGEQFGQVRTDGGFENIFKFFDILGIDLRSSENLFNETLAQKRTG